MLDNFLSFAQLKLFHSGIYRPLLSLSAAPVQARKFERRKRKIIRIISGITFNLSMSNCTGHCFIPIFIINARKLLLYFLLTYILFFSSFPILALFYTYNYTTKIVKYNLNLLIYSFFCEICLSGRIIDKP